MKLMWEKSGQFEGKIQLAHRQVVALPCPLVLQQVMSATIPAVSVGARDWPVNNKWWQKLAILAARPFSL